MLHRAARVGADEEEDWEDWDGAGVGAGLGGGGGGRDGEEWRAETGLFRGGADIIEGE